MSVVEEIATSGMLVSALVITVIALRAWRQTGSRKVLMLAGGFGLFLLKGIILSVMLFAGGWDVRLLPYLTLIDVMVLLVFYVAIIRHG